VLSREERPTEDAEEDDEEFEFDADEFASSALDD
jgi:hypothetical protein